MLSYNPVAKPANEAAGRSNQPAKRAMNNLLAAIRLAYRSYIFDNSGSEMNLVMEATPAKAVVFRTNRIPVWLDEYILSRLN